MFPCPHVHHNMFSSIFKRDVNKRKEGGRKQEKSIAYSSEIVRKEEPMLLELVENERFNSTSKQWSFQFLLPSDPKRYITAAGQLTEFPTDDMLDDSWTYYGDWELDESYQLSPSDKWLYGSSFSDLDAERYLHPSASVVRRRRWIRTVVPKASTLSRISSNSEVSEPTAIRKENLSTPIKKEGSVSDGAADDKSDISDFIPSHEVVEMDDSLVDGTTFDVEYEPPLEQKKDPDPTRRGSMFSGVFGSSNASNSNLSNSNPNSSISAIKVQDTVLTDIGKQIKALESDFKKWEELYTKGWKAVTKPRLEGQVSKLEAKVKSIQARIDLESELGLGLGLEEELKKTVELLETKKKTIFFPNSRIKVGQADVYLGLDDLWLESASGQFVLDLIPHPETPQIHLLLTGNDEAPEAGISVRLLLVGFKFAGDKNFKGIPKIKFDKLAITVGLGCDIGMHFDHSTGNWLASAKEFQVHVKSFKGPYGISRTMVAAVMSFLTPVLRTALLNRLPRELGLFMMSMASPFCMRGGFDIAGTELAVLHTAMHCVPSFCVSCGLSEQQIEMFYSLQKSIDRNTVFKTVEELISYRRNLQRNSKIWDKIAELWNRAALLYSEKVELALRQGTPMKGSSSSYSNFKGIDFSSILRGCDDLLKKRLSLRFKLKYIDGLISLNDVLDFTYSFLQRLCTERLEKSPSPLEEARLNAMLMRIRITHTQFQGFLKSVMKNLDSAQMKMQARFATGPSGEVNLSLRDLIAQLPLNLRFNLSKETNMGGSRPLVPYLTSIRPQKNGEILMEVSHELKASDTSHSTPKKSLTSLTGSGNSSGAKEIEIKHQHPVGLTDKLMTMLSSSPQMSIVVDKLSTFKPGTEIFTMAVGPQSSGNQVTSTAEGLGLGTGSLRSRSYTTFDIVSSSGSSSLLGKQQTHLHNHSTPTLTEASEGGEEMGCPIHIQTADHIKMLTQIPRSEAMVFLPGVVRFVKAHFSDLSLLKSHLEKKLGGEFADEQIEILKLLFEKASKYVLSPDLDIEININGKVISVDDTLSIRIETPDEVKLDGQSQSNSHGSNLPPCAVAVRADICIQDIFDDSKAFDAYIKSIQTSENSAVT